MIYNHVACTDHMKQEKKLAETLIFLKIIEKENYYVTKINSSSY